MNLSPRQNKIIDIMLSGKKLRSSEIHSNILRSENNISLITIKRDIKNLLQKKLIISEGGGRSIKYFVSTLGRLLSETNSKEYCVIEPDKRYGMNRYNFELFSSLPIEIFDEKEYETLEQLTELYKKRISDIPPAIEKRELERLIIELSWKSSKIEGNTYTLLDTEKLILENKKAEGHSKEEADMILNHKDAFNYIRENSNQFETLTKNNLENLHKIMVKNLNVNLGFRKKPVGITGSKYQPLDNVYQIEEAVEALSEAMSKMKTAYDKALLALLGISYIQPFEDGNKRTSRLMANALLIANGKAPLSYRSVEENDYREAMLLFYELNSLSAFKKIFIGQYDFAVKNYAVKNS